MKQTIASAICRHCGRRGGLKPTDGYGEVKLQGYLCTKCASFFPDPVSVMEDVVCSCGKKIGNVSRDVEVSTTVSTKDEKGDLKVTKVIFHKGQSPKKIFCRDCSLRRVKDGLADAECLTRYEIPCPGGCGKIQGWRDVIEGEPPGSLDDIITCLECEPRLSNIARNSRSIDHEIRKLEERVK